MNLTYLLFESLLPEEVHLSPNSPNVLFSGGRVHRYAGAKFVLSTLEDWPVSMRASRATLVECPITAAGLFKPVLILFMCCSRSLFLIILIL